MAFALIWKPPQTPATVLEGNVFPHSLVASTHRHRPNTTVPSFNVKPALLSSQPSTVDTLYPSSSTALRTEQMESEARYAIGTTVSKPNDALVGVEGIYKTDEERRDESQDENDEEDDNFESFGETAEANPSHLRSERILYPPTTLHTRDHVLLSEAEATGAGPSHNNTDCRGPPSAGRIFDVFAEYEEEFGKSLTQKPRPRFAAERHREPAAGGTAVTEEKRDKVGQSRDSLLTQNTDRRSGGGGLPPLTAAAAPNVLIPRDQQHHQSAAIRLP